MGTVQPGELLLYIGFFVAWVLGAYIVWLLGGRQKAIFAWTLMTFFAFIGTMALLLLD